jgi:hypothetical protein
LTALELTYQNFVNRIAETGRKDILLKTLHLIINHFIIFIFAAFIIISAEVIFEFSAPIRKYLFLGYLSAFAASIVMIIIFIISSIIKLKSSSSIKFYAKKIGDSTPYIKDNLLNTIQLYYYSQKNDSIFSKELIIQSIINFNHTAKEIDFKKSINSNFKKIIMLLIGSLFLTSIFFIIFPNSFLHASNRLINYNLLYIDNSLGIEFEVSPGNVEVTKGESLNLFAILKSNSPNFIAENVILKTKIISESGAELSENEEIVYSSKINEFNFTIKNINSKFNYWFEYKGIKSSEYQVTVSNKPVIKSVSITVYPPAYTKLPSRKIESNEITTIAGSKIYIELEASEDISNAVIQFGGISAPVVLNVNNNSANGTFIASASGKFIINVTKEYNNKILSASNPKEYELKIFPDQYPNIFIEEPEKNEINVQGKKDILIRTVIKDDFGFSKMRLGYKIAKSKYGPVDKDFRYADINIINKDATGLEIPYIWNLSPLNLGTEDEVEYFVEIYDNDAYSGPKVSKSQIKKLIYPSLESLLNKTEEEKNNIEQSLKTAYDDAIELKKEIDELKEKIEKNPEELGLNDPEKNQQMQQKLENIQNNLNSTQQKLDELMNNLKQTSQISQETLEKYMELQKLFQKIDSKELREALKKLQDAIRNMDKEMLKEAMKNFKFDEENFKKSLEKTMELLNKILNEQKMGELTQKLDDIKKQQDALKEETKSSDINDANKLNTLANKQEDIKNKYQDFKQQLKELKENMNKSGDQQISKELQKMLEQMMKKMLEQKMQNSQQNLQQGNKNESSKQQDQISQDLSELNEQMQDILQSMIERENSKLQAKMEEFLNRLKQMSQRQRELMDESEELNQNSSTKDFLSNKQKQDKLQNDLSNLTEEMMSMAQQMGMSPMMSKNLGDAFNHMQDASNKLSNKDGKGANKSQSNAKESLDKAIERMQQMCNSGKPGNSNRPGMGLQQLLQQLQEMIARQQQLNNQMQGLSPQGNQGQFTQEQLAHMQKLALEQQKIKEGINQLNDEFKKHQELEGKKMLGNLDQVQKDIEEVIKDLQNNTISPETKKRQEKILSRMLDFQLSAREKDFEQSRESRPGKNFQRNSPPEIILSKPNIINGINQDALEIQSLHFNEDYEFLIQKYLEKIKVKQ